MYQSTITRIEVLGCLVRLPISLLIILSTVQPSFSTTLLSPVCGAGTANIPDATVDGGGATIPGTLSCGFKVTNMPGTVAAGNAVTVSLFGFRHEASGDLIVTLTHFTDETKTVTYGGTQTLFYRIGKLSSDPNDFGYEAQFGDLFTGDNYSFNSGFTTNLWTTAAGLGPANLIPGVAAGFTTGYTTHDAFSSAPNMFSTLFAGQMLNGYWQLDIFDNATGPSFPSIAGSLQQWQLDIDAIILVPEPASAGLMLLGLTGALVGRYSSFKRI